MFDSLLIRSSIRESFETNKYGLLVNSNIDATLFFYSKEQHVYGSRSVRHCYVSFEQSSRTFSFTRSKMLFGRTKKKRICHVYGGYDASFKRPKALDIQAPTSTFQLIRIFNINMYKNGIYIFL